MTLEPLLQASPAIQIHAWAAIAAFGLGAVVLLRRKGGRIYRALGRVWVGLMLVVAFSSFFIHTIRTWGPWSPIHILSVGTIVSLVYAVVLIRRGNVEGHRQTMRATFAGALVIAGLFTFVPGRIMWEVLFSQPLSMPPLWAWPALVLVALAFLGWNRRPRRA